MQRRSRKQAEPKSLYVEYSLDNMRTGNNLGRFPTERDAARMIRNIAKQYGLDGLQWLALGRTDDHGQFELYANGAQLQQFIINENAPPKAVPIAG